MMHLLGTIARGLLCFAWNMALATGAVFLVVWVLFVWRPS